MSATMNRILVFGPENYDKIGFVRRLFQVGEIGEEQITRGDTPRDKQGGLIIEDIPLQTKYYKTDVGVFIDEPETNDPQNYVQWIEELSSDEMSELREQIQLLLVLFPGSDGYEEFTSGPLDKLNALLDAEHCETHKESLQWDGQILAMDTADASLLAEAQNAIQCVVWRNIELHDDDDDVFGALTTRQHGNGHHQDLARDMDLELRHFEQDLSRLRNARAGRAGAVGEDGERGGLSAEEKQLVDTILAGVLGEGPV